SSRRRHTRWPRDWSSDVCSSDLAGPSDAAWAGDPFAKAVAAREQDADDFYAALAPDEMPREQMPILRQACAGLVWSKQMYSYNEIGRASCRKECRTRWAA